MSKEEEFKYLISLHPELASLIRQLLEATAPGLESTDQQPKTDE